MQPHPHHVSVPRSGTSTSSRRTGHPPPSPMPRTDARGEDLVHAPPNVPTPISDPYVGNSNVFPAPSVLSSRYAQRLPSSATYTAQFQQPVGASDFPTYSASFAVEPRQNIDRVPTNLVSHYSVNPNAYISTNTVHIPVRPDLFRRVPSN